MAGPSKRFLAGIGLEFSLVDEKPVARWKKEPVSSERIVTNGIVVHLFRACDRNTRALVAILLALQFLPPLAMADSQAVEEAVYQRVRKLHVTLMLSSSSFFVYMHIIIYAI